MATRRSHLSPDQGTTDPSVDSGASTRPFFDVEPSTQAGSNMPLPSFDTDTTTESSAPLSTALTSGGTKSVLTPDTPLSKDNHNREGQRIRGAYGRGNGRGQADDEGYFGDVVPLTNVSPSETGSYAAVDGVHARGHRARKGKRDQGHGESWLEKARRAIEPMGKMGSVEPPTVAAASSNGGGGACSTGEVHSDKADKPFSMYGAVCLATCCINSWVVMLLAADAGLRYGGPTALVYGLIYTSICTYCTVASHAELFAVYPTAAGQYHWVYAVAPEHLRTALSWFTGMINVAGLWMGNAAAAYLCSILLTSIILLHHPTFEISPSAQYGIFACLVITASLSTLCISNRIIEYALMGLAITGVLSIGITLLAMQTPKASAAFVFAGTANQTGYSSLSIAWLIGLLQSQYAFCGFDLVYHISEEMPNAKRDGPRAAKKTIVVSAIIAWFTIVCVLFCVPDVDEVLNSRLGLAFTHIILTATQSPTATTILVLVVLIMFLNTVRGIAMTATRVLFAFGRDGMLPYGHVFAYTCYGEPIVGTLLTVAVSLVAGLVQLGPAAAFHSLLGSSTVMSFMCYGIPCAVMLFGGRAKLDKAFPDRLHNLGRWGLAYNAIAIIFMLQAMVVYCFPNEVPVTPQNMNYVVVFLAGFGVILGGIWLGHARKHWHGPDVAFLDRISKSPAGVT